MAKKVEASQIHDAFIAVIHTILLHSLESEESVEVGEFESLNLSVVKLNNSKMDKRIAEYAARECHENGDIEAVLQFVSTGCRSEKWSWWRRQFTRPIIPIDEWYISVRCGTNILGKSTQLIRETLLAITNEALFTVPYENATWKLYSGNEKPIRKYIEELLLHDLSLSERI